MVTAVLYVLLIALVAGLLFVIAALVFGRGEQLAPLPRDVSPTWLPDHAIEADDIRGLRFQQTLRGYKASEVDWALQRLANEVERLRAVAAAHDGAIAAEAVDGPAGHEARGDGGDGRDGSPGRCHTGDPDREE